MAISMTIKPVVIEFLGDKGLLKNLMTVKLSAIELPV